MLIFSMLLSCAKEGCTDPDAENYNSSATKSDGSCTFQGRVVFWYNEATSNSLYYFFSYWFYSYKLSIYPSSKSILSFEYLICVS